MVLAALVALGLFGLMQALVRSPPEAPAEFAPASVEWLARAPERLLPERSRPRPGAAPEAARRPAPQEATSAVAVRISRPSLLLSSHPAIVAPALGLPHAVSHAGRPLNWSTPLNDYLSQESRASLLFRPPRLRPRPPSPHELPQRMRLGTGGEIDRIGTQCYAAPFDVADNPEAGPAPVLAREMHAMQSLFAHEVPCDEAGLQGLGDEFLLKLRMLAPAAPSPGTRKGPG